MLDLRWIIDKLGILFGVSAKHYYNIENGYIEDTKGNMLIGVHPSTLNEKTVEDTKDFYMHTLHQIIAAPGYYKTDETWEIFVDIDSDGDRSYIVNGIHGIVEEGCTAYWEGSDEKHLPLEIALAPIDYTISYDVNGGIISDDVLYTTNYNIEKDVILPIPTLNDYVFMGWKVTSSDGSWSMNDVYSLSDIGDGHYGNVTLTADWRKECSFIIVIPETILLDEDGEGTIYIDATIYDFIDTSILCVYANEFNSKLELQGANESIYVEYELEDEQNKINKGDLVASFSNEDTQVKNIYINTMEEPNYSGSYTGKINFFIEYNE